MTERDNPMKIFQIGFAKCGTRYMYKIFTDLGYKGVYNDYGCLAKKIFYNFLNCNRLLNGYEEYQYYGCMENVSMNLFPNMLLYKTLDQQYPGSKFILNTREMDRWIEARLQQPGFLSDYLWSTDMSCTQVVLMKWKELWNKLHKEVVQYFGDRMGTDCILFDVEKDHPKKLLLFVTQKNVVKRRFQSVYDKFAVRMEPISSSESNVLKNTDVYCMYMPDREKHIKQTLATHGFPACQYIRSIVPDELDKQDYTILSSVHLYGPPLSDCNVCSHNSWHPAIYLKPCKLCVHMSYLVCLYHSILHSSKDYTLIFEDDVYFEHSAPEMVQTCKEFMESGMDALYLGFGHCKEGESLRSELPFGRIIELPKNQSIICKHAILYKNTYLKKMFWDLLPLVECSDVQFNHVNILHQARVCIPTTPFVFQDRRKFGSFNQNEQETEIPLF